MNILPFPALDGGRIVVAKIEGVIRRKLPVKFVQTFQSVILLPVSSAAAATNMLLALKSTRNMTHLFQN